MPSKDVLVAFVRIRIGSRIVSRVGNFSLSDRKRSSEMLQQNVMTTAARLVLLGYFGAIVSITDVALGDWLGGAVKVVGVGFVSHQYGLRTIISSCIYVLKECFKFRLGTRK